MCLIVNSMKLGAVFQVFKTNRRNLDVVKFTSKSDLEPTFALFSGCLVGSCGKQQGHRTDIMGGRAHGHSQGRAATIGA